MTNYYWSDLHLGKEAHGGKASGSVAKSTSLLVCGEEGSSKWVKAKNVGVSIVTPGEFAGMLGLSRGVPTTP